MEKWQLHQLVDRMGNGEKRTLGGAIVDLPIVSAIGPLNEVEVTPIDEETMPEFWNGQYVCLKLADRMVWLDSEETHALIDLLQMALKAAEENVKNANID